MGDFWEGANLMVITDLSSSFNPCPKNPVKKEKITTKIKQKSKKLAKAEKNRFSILQEENGKCFICNRQLKKLDKHEALGGSNRQKSIQYGLVYYLCRKCHQKADLDKNTRNKLQNYAKKQFIKKYSKEKFLKEFGKNYIEK